VYLEVGARMVFEPEDETLLDLLLDPAGLIRHVKDRLIKGTSQGKVTESTITAGGVRG
jgi:hypothetical protein